MSLPALFTVFLYFSLFILIPGFLLFSIIFKDKKDFIWVETIPLSFVFGLVFLTIIGLPAYLLHFSYTTFFIVFAGVSIILLLLNIYLWTQKKRNFIFEKNRFSVLLTLIFALMVFILVLICFPSVDKSGDRLSHTGKVRRMALNETINPYLSLFKDVPDKIDSAYGYNIWYLSESLIFRAVPVNPNLIWEYLILILAPIQMLSFGLLARKLIKDNLFYFTALMIFMTLAGIWTIGYEWRFSPYPDQIARHMILPVVLGLWFLLIKKDKIDWLILTGIVLSGVSLLLIHLFSVICFLVTIIGMIIFSFLVDKKYQILKKGLLVLASWFILSLPILYLKYLTFLQIVPTTFGSANWKTIGVNGSAIINPDIWKDAWTYLIAIGAILLLFIWQLITRKKLSLAVMFCFASAFFAAFLSFVPPVANFVVKIITSTYLSRMITLIPLYLIFALFIYELIKIHKVLKWIGVFLLIIFFSYIIWIQKDVYAKGFRERSVRMKSPILQIPGLMNYINQNISPSAVIASDGQLGLDMFDMTNNYLVMIKHQQCPAIVDKKERLTDLANILSPGLAEQNKPLFEKYQVDYIVSSLNDAKEFGKYPQIFTKVYNNGTYALFKVNRTE